MNFEKYTNSSKKIINAAQNLALGKKHQKITPMHIFSELLNSNHDLIVKAFEGSNFNQIKICLLYTSPSPRDTERARMPSSA